MQTACSETKLILFFEYISLVNKQNRKPRKTCGNAFTFGVERERKKFNETVFGRGMKEWKRDLLFDARNERELHNFPLRHRHTKLSHVNESIISWNLFCDVECVFHMHQHQTMTPEYFDLHLTNATKTRLSNPPRQLMRADSWKSALSLGIWLSCVEVKTCPTRVNSKRRLRSRKSIIRCNIVKLRDYDPPRPTLHCVCFKARWWWHAT